MHRRWVLLLSAGAVAAAAVTMASPVDRSEHAPAPGVATQVAQRTDPLSDTTFAGLIARISEPGGYFDTDNLISNESSYLHVIGTLASRGVRGGAYLGVGPDQNFSYIVAIRPRIAFILDIRRDNQLEHLLFKALFALAPTRVEYLSLLFGRAVPDDPAAYRGADLEQVLAWVDRQPPEPDRFEATTARVAETVRAFGLPLDDDDYATIRRFHATFFAAGPDLRFNSFGRAPRPYYPTYRQLLLATDRNGRRAGWLVREEDYAFLRELQLDNRVIPVVGDFAGNHALREIAAVLRERGYRVSAFYTSNVEYYLMQDRVFTRFAENVATLPVHDHAVLIRSVFGQGVSHPLNLRGHYSTQLAQSMGRFLEHFRAGEYRSYGDLVWLDFLR